MPRQASMGLALGAILLVMGIARLAAEVPLLTELEARDNAEAIVYGQAMRWLRSEPLYQPLDQPPYTVTAYMPLYYTLAALGHAILGPSFLAGRLLTLISTIVLALTVAALARRVTDSPVASILATGLVLTVGFAGPPGPVWMAVYRVDAFGVALAVGAMTVLAGGAENGRLSYRRVMVAGLLAALALLTKQTLAAATLAGGLWLLGQSWRKTIVFGSVAGGLPLIVGAAFEWWTAAFIQNTVRANINPFDVVSLGQNLFILSIFQLAPAIAALCLIATRGPGSRGSARRLVIYYAVAATLPLLGLAKVGSWHNYWIEWSVPVSVLAASALAAPLRTPALHHRLAFITMSVAMLFATLLGTFVAGWSIRNAVASLSDQSARAASVAELVRCVRAAPGAGIGMPMDVVVLAGKPLYVEPAIFTILVDAGVVQGAPVIETIKQGGVGVVVMDLRPEGAQWQHGAGQPIWRPDVLDALRETMALRSEKAGRLVYTPKDQPPPPECR